MEIELEKKDVLRLSNEESNQLTRECLRIAMFKLMCVKDFEKITITEIAKEAGVSRVAFYRNYASKEALVEDVCQSLITELKASLNSEVFRTDRKQWYQDLFQMVKENEKYFRLFLHANIKIGDVIVLDMVYPPSTVQEHYLNIAGEAAFMSILTDWFGGGMKETPEEMAGICEDMHLSFINK